MTSALPFDEIFPHLNPLCSIDDLAYPLVGKSIAKFAQEHEYYLANYIDQERIEKSVAFLEKFAKKHKLTLDQAIAKFIEDFDILDFNTTSRKLVAQQYEPGAWIIWIFITSAFILLNQAIAHGDVTAFAENIETSFRNAHDYKRLWFERAGRYKGAEKNAEYDRKLKEEIRIKWSDIKNSKKKQCPKSAAQYLLIDCNYDKNISYDTMIKYVREWLKTEKNKK